MIFSVKKSSSTTGLAPDLSEFRRRYPLTVTHFSPLADREGWLRRIWEMDAEWRAFTERNGHEKGREAIVNGKPPSSLTLEAEYEIIYAGGALLALLHAAVMAHRYQRRVMIFNESETTERERSSWNSSDDELRELERAGLFSAEEIESLILNRYRSGFVKFHDAASRVKTPPLWVDGVLDIAVDMGRLFDLATAKIRNSQAPSDFVNRQRFVRCYIQPDKVFIEIEDTRTLQHRLFAARLFIDCTGAYSPVAQQLNDGRAITHVCPTVGTVARGFKHGPEPDKVDFNVGELLVSNEDARDHRQLIWEGLAGRPSSDEYTTHLFFYDAVDSPADKSLLALFEQYFEALPRYKRAGAQWRVTKPLFGYLPISQQSNWRQKREHCTADRVMLINNSARLSAPLRVGGLSLRHLQRLTHLTNLALEADLLDARSLSEINSNGHGIAQVSSFAEFLRPTPKSAPAAVNETLNAVMLALHNLDERVRRELFQDCMTLSALKKLLSHTVRLYPRILQRVREHMGARGVLWWLADIAEAAFSEKRERIQISRGSIDDEKDAVQEFARHVRFYKKQNGASDR